VLKLVVAMVWFGSISIQTMTLMSPATMAMHLMWMIVSLIVSELGVVTVSFALKEAEHPRGATMATKLTQMAVLTIVGLLSAVTVCAGPIWGLDKTVMKPATMAI
jgi:hypothetical protein